MFTYNVSNMEFLFSTFSEDMDEKTSVFRSRASTLFTTRNYWKLHFLKNVLYLFIFFLPLYILVTFQLLRQFLLSLSSFLPPSLFSLPFLVFISSCHSLLLFTSCSVCLSFLSLYYLVPHFLFLVFVLPSSPNFLLFDKQKLTVVCNLKLYKVRDTYFLCLGLLTVTVAYQIAVKPTRWCFWPRSWLGWCDLNHLPFRQHVTQTDLPHSNSELTNSSPLCLIVMFISVFFFLSVNVPLPMSLKRSGRVRIDADRFLMKPFH